MNHRSSTVSAAANSARHHMGAWMSAEKRLHGVAAEECHILTYILAHRLARKKTDWFVCCKCRETR